MSELLSSSLEVAVPLWIERIRPNIEEELKNAPDLAEIIACESDNVLYKSKKPGETAKVFNALARAIAILSFLPGGVSILGLSFESSRG